MAELINIDLSNSQAKSILHSLTLEQANLQQQIEPLLTRINDYKYRFEENEKLIKVLLSKVDKNEPDLELTNINGTAYIELKSAGFNSDPGKKNGNHQPVKSWWEKVSTLLKDKNKLLFGKEIVEISVKNEYRLNDRTVDEKNVHGNVYALLTNKVKSGALVRVKVGKEFMYGLKNWFNEKGEVKEDYKNK